MFRRWIVVAVTGLAGVASADPGRRIVVGSAVDESSASGHLERRANAATVKRALDRLVAREAPGRGEPRQLDVAVVSVTVEPFDDRVAVTAEVRIAVSGSRGTLLQVYVGGAKVEIDGRSYRAAQLASLREDALEGAVQAVYSKVKRSLPARELVVANR